MKNRKGFTLIELLATLVILGIIMAVAVPNVVGILTKNRNSTYVEDAKKLATTAEYMYRSNNTESKNCFTLGELNSNEFENPPYDGEYLENESYVKIDSNGKYIVTLIEKLPDSGGYRGINNVDADDLYLDNATNIVINITSPSGGCS